MGGLGYTPRLPLLFILGRDGREGNDWKNKTEEPSSDSVGTLFHWINMSLTRNTNATWSTSCKETKRPHTGWTWADSSSLNSQATCLSSDEECRSQTPLKEEMECCLAIIIIEKEHIASLEVCSTSPPCSHHSWCSTDGTEDPAPNDDTRSSYRWNTNLSITPPCRCKRDSVMYSTRSEPTCLEESFSTMITVTLYPLGILSCRFATLHSPHASTVHSCF